MLHVGGDKGRVWPKWFMSAVKAAFCLFLGLAMTGSMRASSVHAPPLEYAHGSDSSGWIPFELYRGKHIYLKATVNGRAATALLDSGASLVVVNQPSASSFGIRPAGVVSGVGVGGVAKSSLASGFVVTAGSLKIRVNRAVVVDDSELDRRSGHSQDIALGGDIFQHAIVDIDFEHRRLAIRDPEAFKPPADAQIVRLHRAGDIRAVDAVVEGRPVRMLFDLGNGGAVYLHQHFWDRTEFLEGRRLSSSPSGGWTGPSVQKAAMLRRLTVGETSFSEVPSILRKAAPGEDSATDGNIGLPVWSRFHLIVDFPHDRLMLAPPVDRKTPFSVNHTGLSLVNVPEGMQITHVALNSPAEAAGLKTGEIISRVEDAATGQTVVLSFEWTSAPVDTLFRIVLADGRIVPLTTGEYF